MASKRRFLDVWIVDSNTVYREVPFAVVTDWVQEGRLLAEDRLRPSGTTEWLAVGSVSAFAAYLPKAEPFRAEDQAEALEPVQVDFGWKKPRGDEDQDVDMIPLIDISLVLLIFFMMTSAVGGVTTLIQTPTAEHNLLLVKADMIWIGISKNDKGNVYSIGKGEAGPDKDDINLSEAQVLQRLDARIKASPTKLVDVQLKADETLPYETVQKMTIALQRKHAASTATGGVREIYGGVRTKEKK